MARESARLLPVNFFRVHFTWPVFASTLYNRVAEPRLPKLAHFVIYISTTVAGLVAFLGLPPILVQLIGPTMVTVFGLFGFVGSILALVSVLPHILWLERVGIILLLTAVMMYIVMVLFSNVTTVALWLIIPLAISLGQRLHDITPLN